MSLFGTGILRVAAHDKEYPDGMMKVNMIYL